MHTDDTIGMLDANAQALLELGEAGATPTKLQLAALRVLCASAADSVQLVSQLAKPASQEGQQVAHILKSLMKLSDFKTCEASSAIVKLVDRCQLGMLALAVAAVDGTDTDVEDKDEDQGKHETQVLEAGMKVTLVDGYSGDGPLKPGDVSQITLYFYAPTHTHVHTLCARTGMHMWTNAWACMYVSSSRAAERGRGREKEQVSETAGPEILRRRDTMTPTETPRRCGCWAC